MTAAILFSSFIKYRAGGKNLPFNSQVRKTDSKSRPKDNGSRTYRLSPKKYEISKRGVVTRKRNPGVVEINGKAAIKAAKKATHYRGFYLIKRQGYFETKGGQPCPAS